ncbi:MAG: exo-alpha-sialidase [Opitutus sp.]|nr:exo-alpha-sialidase [Opitutus sp.]
MKAEPHDCRPRRRRKPAAIAVLAAMVAMAIAGRAAAASGPPVPEMRPVFQRVSVVAVAEPAERQPYLAFPALVDLGDRILVSYKRGRSHGDDPGAVLDLVAIDPTRGSATAPRVIAALEDRIMQMGEWARFANGDIASYIDAQQPVAPERVGLRSVRSTDGGKNFGPLERVGTVDGVEYGYAFEAITEGRDTWMLAMTFSNLPGGRSIYPGRPAAGSVDVIRTGDNGRTWHLVRGLTKEFGDIPINESSFLRQGDGFLVTTRGYDNRERLHLTDGDFKVRRQVDLTATYDFITSYVGRPRLFARDGRVYLLGRNWTKPTPLPAGPPVAGGPTRRINEQLCLFRIDPEQLAVTAYCVLDNAEAANVTDGYYAMPFFREVDGRTRLNVITYKGVDGQPPQIIRLEYLWDEVR